MKRPHQTICITLIFLAIVFFSKQVFSDTFIVGCKSEGYPPFYFEQGNPETGIYADILNAVGLLTGDTFKKKYYPAPRKYMMFEQNLIDIEPGINPEWRKQYSDISVYTIPFGRASDVMIFRKGTKFPIKDISDLKGKSVGTVRGYFYPGYMEAFKDGHIKRDDAKNEEQLLLKLMVGRTNLAFINTSVAHYLIRLHNYECEFGNVIGDVGVMFRFHISKKYAIERFNQALKKLLQDGTIDKIYGKYR